MILSQAMTPGAEESRPGAETFQKLLRELFFTGEDMPTGQTAAEQLSPVAAAHRILSNAFGVIPFGVFQKVDGARLPVEDETLQRIFTRRPNAYMTPFVLNKVVMSNAFWHGFGAVWNRRDSAGRLTERIALPTDCCSIYKDPEGPLYWYSYNVDGVQRVFAPRELSILFFETYNGIWGRGLLDLARESMAADALAQRYGRKFYQNGARISGIVEVDTDAKPATKDKVRREFARYATDDAFKVAVLDHGMKYTPLGLNQSDAQFIESRTFSVEEIARFTGVPKHMLQTGKESYDSNQQQRVNYVTDTLVPFVAQWEQQNREKLLTRSQRSLGWYIHGNVSVLLRGDDLSRSQFYERMIRNSIYNPDECRTLEEKPPIPGGLGQEFFLSKNMGSLRSIVRGGEGNG